VEVSRWDLECCLHDNRLEHISRILQNAWRLRFLLQGTYKHTDKRREEKFKAASKTYRELRLEDKTNSLQRLQLRSSRRFNTNSNLRTNLNKPTYVQINEKFKATSKTYREFRLEDKTNSLQRLQLRSSRRFNANSNLRTNLNKPTYVQINVEKTTLISYDNARTKKCQGDTTNNISNRNTPNWKNVVV